MLNRCDRLHACVRDVHHGKGRLSNLDASWSYRYAYRSHGPSLAATQDTSDYTATPNGAPGQHTLNQVYGNKTEFVQVDHLQRRKTRDLADIAQAALKQGMDKETVRLRLLDLEALLPELAAPNLDRMKASDWARVLPNVDRAAGVLIAIKTSFPSVNVARIIARCPKMLLMDPQEVASNGQQVGLMLGTASDPGAIIDAVPQLLNPAALTVALANLRQWFKTDDAGAIAQLERSPGLLLNVEESDLEPDAEYGELTVAG